MLATSDRSRTLKRVRNVVVLAVIGLVGIDAGSITLTHFTANNSSGDVGLAAVQQTYGKPITASVAEQAYQAAESVAEDNGEQVLKDSSFVVHTDGSVSFVLVKHAPTLFAQYISGLRPELTVTVHASHDALSA